MASISSDPEREAYQNSFGAKVQQFMVTNAAAFNALTEEISASEEDSPKPHLQLPHGASMCPPYLNTCT